MKSAFLFSGALLSWIIVGCGGNDGGSETTAGTPGASTGGTSAGTTPGGSAGAQSRGGTSAGGTTAAGGAIDPDLAAACRKGCNAQAAAGCSEGMGCERSCDLFASKTECRDAMKAAFECAEGKTVQCDTDGSSRVAGCEVQEQAALACFADPTLMAPCDAACKRQEAAMCPGQEAHGDCVLGCQVTGGVLSACGEAYRALLTCQKTAKFTCDKDGEAAQEGCIAESLAFFGCFLSGAAGQ